jgi:hypothetical protein
MIEIAIYQQVNGVSFGCEEVDLIAAFGQPEARRVNREGEMELHYPNYIARLDASSKRFREFTLLPGCDANINGIRVEWQPRFLSTIQEVDSALMEVLGFILSLKTGLAFSGFHDDDSAQMAIHAFCKGDWDIFRDQMKPFRYTG